MITTSRTINIYICYYLRFLNNNPNPPKADNVAAIIAVAPPNSPVSGKLKRESVRTTCTVWPSSVTTSTASDSSSVSSSSVVSSSFSIGLAGVNSAGLTE